MPLQSEERPGAVAPDKNDGNPNPEPGATTGGERSTPAAPAQAERRAGNKPQDGGDDVDRWFAKGARAAKRELHEEIEREHGAPLKSIIEEWKGFREAQASGKQTESAEITKLQRQLAHWQGQMKTKDDSIASLTAEVNGFKVTQPIMAAVRRVNPKSERYEAILVSEVAKRVKLDDDGELTVMSPDGRPQHKSTLDDLCKEVADAMPDLVTPPRVGTGVKPQVPQLQREAAPNGSPISRAERIAALSKLQ